MAQGALLKITGREARGKRRFSKREDEAVLTFRSYGDSVTSPDSMGEFALVVGGEAVGICGRLKNPLPTIAGRPPGRISTP